MEVSDLSTWSLIANADFVVQAVIFFLITISIFCWSIIFDKLIKLRKQKKRADLFEDYFCSGQILENVYNNLKNRKDSIFINIFILGINEFKDTNKSEKQNHQFVQRKLGRAIEIGINQEITKLEKNTDWLATAGSTAPFIGLLGTVWGIMNSFRSIALTKNTNLTVVAPSIAEALLATAAGLMVAIPAVIFYNRIIIKINSFSERLSKFSLDLQFLLMKNLNEKKIN